LTRSQRRRDGDVSRAITSIRLLLGEQLTRSLASLRDFDRSRDIVLMAEVHAKTTYVRHHKQKIAFFPSALRHFAAELSADGMTASSTLLSVLG